MPTDKTAMYGCNDDGYTTAAMKTAMYGRNEDGYVWPQ
jgi:hypothetical protein